MKKERKITFNVEVANDSTKVRLGGKSFLPLDFAWPKNPDGENLTLIFSIPCEFINDYIENEYPKDYYISVFTTYSKDPNAYFLDLVTYSGDEFELNNILGGYTKVIIHKRSDVRNESEYEVPSRLIDTSLSNNTSDDMSRIGGRPSFLQPIDFNFDENLFLLQFYAANFPEGFKDIIFLSDAIGYLFINTKLDLSQDNMGLFFAQTT